MYFYPHSSPEPTMGLLPMLLAPPLAAAAVNFTVSGHSSGGLMAAQHFMAFSDRIVGMGQIESSADFPNASAAAAAAAAGLIAPIEHLKTARVYAMQGGDDQCAKNAPALAAAFYRSLGFTRSDEVPGAVLRAFVQLGS